MKYCNKFFKTEQEAKAFQKQHGGAYYKNTPGSRTRRSYRDEAYMAGKDPAGEFGKEYPFVIAWNE